jgi:hypothetical protein
MKFGKYILIWRIFYQILKIHTYFKKFVINFENTYLFEEIWYEILKMHTYLKKVITFWKYIPIWRILVSNFENINLFEEIW